MSAKRRKQNPPTVWDNPSDYMKMIDEEATLYHKHDCLVPVNGHANCPGKCCGSHSIQERVLLERLAAPFDSKCILDYRLNAYNGYLHFEKNIDSIWPREVPYGDASKVPFACGPEKDGHGGLGHDNSTFLNIEGKAGADTLKLALADGISDCMEELFQFCLRAYFATIGQLNVTLRLLDVQEGLLTIEQRPSQAKQNLWLMICQRDKAKISDHRNRLKELKGKLESTRRTIEEIYLSESYEKMSHTLVSFDSEVRIAAASSYFASFLTVLPDRADDDRHTALISWIPSASQSEAGRGEEGRKRSKHLRNLSSVPKELLRHILTNAYNTYTSINYLSEIDDDFQRLIRSDREKLIRQPNYSEQ